jgi:hypothetical protein
MQPIASGALAGVGYDPATRHLDVLFRGGRIIYTYLNEPAAEYHGLITAASSGSYFNQRIRPYFGRQ